jgi:hypothetical protein
MIDERKRLSAQVTPISVGNRVAPMNTGGLAQQQVQQSAMRGLYGGKKMAKKGSKKKETEQNENKEWDTGFGELYEKIDDRKVKNLFPKIKEIQV